MNHRQQFIVLNTGGSLDMYTAADTADKCLEIIADGKKEFHATNVSEVTTMKHITVFNMQLHV